MNENRKKCISDFTLAYYSSDRKTGSLHIVSRKNNETKITELERLPKTDLDKTLKPILIGITENHQIITLDPETKKIQLSSQFPCDSFAAHNYPDPTSHYDWLMNDGDKETGNDTLNCLQGGSSVTVIEGRNSSNAKYLGTICVGRGHHQACFSHPSDNAPHVPRQAYISNLKDGTVSVIGNDPDQQSSFLKVIATIDLCEPEKEDHSKQPIPNNAFPHGLVYSKVSGKIYNLNNGYGTIAVIDPLTHEIEQRISFAGHSNLFVTPDGRYIIGRGADRKSDTQHVIAKLTVFDVKTHTILDSLTLKDVYISKYYFNPEGTRLFLTTSSSGNDKQKENLKTDALLVFDLDKLPALSLLGELRLGSPSGSLTFVKNTAGTSTVFSSNSADGKLIVIDSDKPEIIETLDVCTPISHSRTWAIN